MKNLKYTLIVLLFFTISCEKNESEWIDLFDGKSTDGWRAYNGKEIPQKWAAVDGELTFDTDLKLENEWKGGGDIIYYKEEFEYFELYLEWKLPKGGNSGVFYNVQEGFQAPYAISPEYQLIDDLGWEEINNAKLEEWQKAGANYAMHEADLSKKQLNPAGQWNSSRILYTAKKVQHWLNGELLLEFEPYSKEWLLKRDSGKWDDYPDYGKFRKGYIALQDHDSPIWFRNIKIRKL
ncbi:MAG: DUF1080 domain-containing protein [Flavobacteriales bacterium]|jgi:hypothetical protein|nr:glycosyl hydrolase [Flavobacteriaceae bacterium]RZP06668.1 MAG: DUF1080 domain-containing protein [Flavobacteriales bacterium]|tara:strand:+ start:294 stop:1001 length:708 start_codon:yes stop_codon:yes gene_type:complete